MDSSSCYSNVDYTYSSNGATHPITAALSMLPLIPTVLNRSGLSTYLPSSSWITFIMILTCISFLVFIIIRGIQWFIMSYLQKQPIYIMDFTTYKAPDEWKVPTEKFVEHARNVFKFSEEALTFSEKILSQSGLGQETAFPPGLLSNPPNLSMPMARAEAELVMFGCLDELFQRTHTHPSQIDILIVNCSLFAPTPSLAAMIINHYGMREDVEAYNLSGMGCSAGLISVNLAKDLLQVHKNSICIIVSTENITQNIYLGKERGMQISNTLFRVGGAAIMLSNMKSLPHASHQTSPSVLSLTGASVHGLFSSDHTNRASGTHARFQMEHVIRTHMGAKHECYNVVFQDDDAEGHTGVRLGKELMIVAGKALRQNITRLAPKILPWSEQIRFALVETKRVIQRVMGRKPCPSYTPNFKKAVQHFCIHAGGRGVIDAIQTNLSLTDDDVAPSRATLKRFGNTSSSSIWYELEFITQNDRLHRGDKIWQIAFGSGFKCNSAVWKAL